MLLQLQILLSSCLIPIQFYKFQPQKNPILIIQNGIHNLVIFYFLKKLSP